MEKTATVAPIKYNHKRLAPKVIAGQTILTILITLFTVFCFAPVLLTFISAFTDEMTINQNGFSFWPEKWSMVGMNSVLKYGNKLFTSYMVTIFVTVFGTLFGLLVMSMYAYSISRKGFVLSGYMIFTRYYGLKNNLLALILPLCMTTMNVIILRTYIANSIPGELMEAAKIDGAGDYRTFFQITLPLMKPSLAAVGFMLATTYWNDWQNALLYISDDKLKPLQLLLVNIQKNISFLLNNTNVPASVRAAMGGAIPQYSATMATVLVVIGPIMVVYPFFQKYFIKGLTVGSVKG